MDKYAEGSSSSGKVSNLSVAFRLLIKASLLVWNHAMAALHSTCQEVASSSRKWSLCAGFVPHMPPHALSCFLYYDVHAQYQEHATYRDPESLEEVPLVPGMSKTDNMLRWGFIKKVGSQPSAMI